MKLTLTSILRLGLGVLVTAGFLWLLGRQVSWADLREVFSRLSPAALLAALAFLAAGYSVRIVRWWWMLRFFDRSVSLKACAWPFLVSIAVNNLVPFRAGDALRVVGFQAQLRTPAMRLLGTLFLERLLDLTVLLAFFFVGLMGARVDLVPPQLVRAAAIVAALACSALVGLLLLADRLQGIVAAVIGGLGLPARWRSSATEHANGFFSSLRVLGSPTATFLLLGMSIVLWTLEGGVFYTVGRALDLQAGPGAAWFALATGTLATLLPSSPGYVGTFDFFTVMALVAYDADRGAATAFAIVVHLVLWVPLTAAGGLYVVGPGARLTFGRTAPAVVAVPEEAP